MATRVPVGLSAAEGRQFGLTVGAAFAVLGALSFWRGHTSSPFVFGAVGAVLVALAIVAPTRLGPVQRFWMGLAEVLSKVTTPVFMGIVYFAVISPIALVRRALGKNSLKRQPSGGAGSGFWVSRERAGQRTSSMEHQF